MVEFDRIKELFKLSSIYSLGGLITRGLSFLLYPIYTTVLTPSQFGIIGIAGFVMRGSRDLFTLGTQASAFNFYHRYDETEREEFYSSLVILCLLTTVTLLIALELVGPALFEFLLDEQLYDPYLRIALLTAAIIAVFHIIPKQRFKAREQAKYFSLMDISQGLLNHTATMIALLVLSLGVLGYLYANLLAAITVGVFGAAVLLSNFTLQFSYPKIRDALRYSIPMFPHYYSHFLISMADRILLTRLGTLSGVGVYTVGYTMATGVQMIVTSGNNAIMPEFSRASDDDTSFQRLPGVTTYYISVCGAATVGFSAFMPIIIEHFFGSGYSSATFLMPWLAMAFFANALYYPPMNVLTQTGRETRAIPLITVAAAVLNVGANLVLIPLYGIVGAAASTLLSYAFLAVAIYLFSRTAVTVPYEYRRVAIIVLATVAGVSVTTVTPTGTLGLEVAGGIVPLVVFATVLTALGFWSSEEIGYIREWL